MTTEANHRATFGSALIYRDPRSALEWLENAFGFRTTLLIADTDGNLVHSEMSFGNGYIMVGNEWHAKAKSSIDNANTQNVHVQLTEDVNAHCERARSVGAVIEMEPEDQFYGDRTYRARDPEGHVWTFSQTVKPMTQDEWSSASGLTVTNSL